MGTTLQHGIFLPAEGERNCYAGLASNWTILDGVVGGYSSHAANLTIHVTAEDKTKWDAVTGKADASALTAHTGDTTIHVTAEDKEAWNGKADASALTAHTGNATIHVTAEDKNKWDAATTKANDADVLHKTGDETSTGVKGFLGIRTEFKRTNGDGVLLFGNGTFTKGSSINDSINICRKYYGDATSVSSALGYSSVTVTNQGNRTMFQFYCIANTAGSTTRTTLQLNYDKSLSGTDAQYMSVTGNIYPSADNSYNLGSLTNRWKQLNGISPGALSLPDFSAGVDISGYITAGNTHNEYTPTVDGWITVALKSTSGACALWIYQNDICNGFYGNTTRPGDTEPFAAACIPVKANTVVSIDTKGSNSYVYAAKFYPCRGNV